MATTTVKRDATIRFRAEEELKDKLERIAALKKKRAAEFLRDEMWRVVERDAELLLGTPAEPKRAVRRSK